MGPETLSVVHLCCLRVSGHLWGCRCCVAPLVWHHPGVQGRAMIRTPRSCDGHKQ